MPKALSQLRSTPSELIGTVGSSSRKLTDQPSAFLISCTCFRIAPSGIFLCICTFNNPSLGILRNRNLPPNEQECSSSPAPSNTIERNRSVDLNRGLPLRLPLLSPARKRSNALSTRLQTSCNVLAGTREKSSNSDDQPILTRSVLISRSEER